MLISYGVDNFFCDKFELWGRPVALLGLGAQLEDGVVLVGMIVPVGGLIVVPR